MTYHLRKVLSDFLVLIECWDNGSLPSDSVLYSELRELNKELSEALKEAKLPVVEADKEAKLPVVEAGY